MRLITCLAVYLALSFTLVQADAPNSAVGIAKEQPADGPSV